MITNVIALEDCSKKLTSVALGLAGGCSYRLILIDFAQPSFVAETKNLLNLNS